MILPPFRIVRDGGAVQVTLEAFEEDGRRVCGIFALEGHIDLPPRAWLRAVRRELRTLEDIARNAGCSEMRLGGRDWSRLLAGLGYERMAPEDGVPNGLRKVL